MSTPQANPDFDRTPWTRGSIGNAVFSGLLPIIVLAIVYRRMVYRSGGSLTLTLDKNASHYARKSNKEERVFD